jgi:hypothetical protein
VKVSRLAIARLGPPGENPEKGLTELTDSSGPRMSLTCLSRILAMLVLAVGALCAAPAGAVDAIRVNPDTAAIDMTRVVQ